MKFIKTLLLFIRMYRDGFFFSENTHKNPDGRWGFYRFNYESPNKLNPPSFMQEYAIFDIDFDFAKRGNGYFHVHGDDLRLHWNKNKKVTHHSRR